MLEEWKDVVGYEGLYRISNFGRLYSCRKVGSKGVMKKVSKNKDGYFRTNLCKNGKVKGASLHRLVGKAFIPNLEGKSEINHRDLCKQNNRIDNLEWGTHQHNMDHAYKNREKWAVKGEDQGISKLSEKQVRVIKHMFNIPNRIALHKMAKIFGVSYYTIQDIKYGRSWNHVVV